MKLLWYSGKISDFHPTVPGSIPGGNFFKKSQIFLITRGFQKFWQKTWNQQLLFYYSIRRGSVVQCSDSTQVSVVSKTCTSLSENYFVIWTILNLSQAGQAFEKKCFIRILVHIWHEFANAIFYCKFKNTRHIPK